MAQVVFHNETRGARRTTKKTISRTRSALKDADAPSFAPLRARAAASTEATKAELVAQNPFFLSS